MLLLTDYDPKMKNVAYPMKICLCIAQRLPGCTHVFPEDNVAIGIGRNRWTNKHNCDIMEDIYFLHKLPSTLASEASRATPAVIIEIQELPSSLPSAGLALRMQ